MRTLFLKKQHTFCKMGKRSVDGKHIYVMVIGDSKADLPLPFDEVLAVKLEEGGGSLMERTARALNDVKYRNSLPKLEDYPLPPKMDTIPERVDMETVPYSKLVPNVTAYEYLAQRQQDISDKISAHMDVS